MIVGIGSDLIDIRRIEKTLERFGERFVMRVFTEEERYRSDRRRLRAASYAKRFAAKEPAPRRLEQGSAWGLPGGRWVLSIFRPANRQFNLPGPPNTGFQPWCRRGFIPASTSRLPMTTRWRRPSS